MNHAKGYSIVNQYHICLNNLYIENAKSNENNSNLISHVTYYINEFR